MDDVTLSHNGAVAVQTALFFEFARCWHPLVAIPLVCYGGLSLISSIALLQIVISCRIVSEKCIHAQQTYNNLTLHLPRVQIPGLEDYKIHKFHNGSNLPKCIKCYRLGMSNRLAVVSHIKDMP